MVRIEIGGKSYDNFTLDNLSLMYNSITSTFGFSGLYDFASSANEFPTIKIYHGDDLVLTGTIINQSFETNAKPTLVSISGYSKAGVLDDCTIPESMMPLELNDVSLKEVCEKILPYFGIEFTYENSVAELMTKKFEKTSFDFDKTIKSVIVDLANERGIFCNHTANGNIRFTDSSASNLSITEHFEDFGNLNATLDINRQGMHSDITVLASSNDSTITEGEYTIKNPYVKTKRPIICKMQNGDSLDVKEFARLKLSTELRGIELKITTTKFVKPGRLITIKSSKLRLNKPTAFFVEQTDIKQDVNGLTYDLKCVLKDVYTKTIVKNVLG
jgi:prophage tail gpP-like protein